MSSKAVHYALLSQHDADDGGRSLDADHRALNGESISPLVTQSGGRPQAWTHNLHRSEWVTRGVLILLSLAFFTLWITSAGAPMCTYVVKYSPANAAIEYIERFRYKGALYFQTPWRGSDVENPSPDIDAAWRRISTDVKPIRVTEEQANRMGMVVTPTTVTFPEEEGGGYLASLEIAHHLQCLDMLRKATYREYYATFDPAFQTEDETLMNQLDACVELLRQDLMCYPDLNLVAFYWLRGHKSPFPDNASVHRCKNFEKILDWAAEKAVDVSHLGSYRAREAEGRSAGTQS